MTTTRLTCFLVLGAAAACSSDAKTAVDSGAGIDSPARAIDAQGLDARAVDAAPACVPAVPAPTVIAAGGADDPRTLTAFVLTSTGEATVAFYGSDGSLDARTWEADAWGDHEVIGPQNSAFGNALLADDGGRPAWLADGNAEVLQFSPQLSTGTFATAASIPGITTAEASAARYTASTSVFAVAADDEMHDVYDAELNSAGSWTVQTVATAATNREIRSAGIGAFSNATAVVAVQVEVTSGAGSGSLELYNRSGINWSDAKTLATGDIIRAWVEFPPDGATGGSGIAVYEDATTNLEYGVFFSTTGGTPGGVAALSSSRLDSPYADIVFAPDGKSGKILLTDDSSPPSAFIVPFDGTSFAPAEALRPDLVFDARPHLVYHPCGGYMIEHVTRASSAASGSAPMVFEPLATFAPGL